MEASATLNTTLTDRLKTRLDHLVVRMRTALDLPSRAEMLELTTRLEELDRRIAALAAERVAAMSTTVAALPEAPAAESPAAEAPAPAPAVEANSEPTRPSKPRKR